MRSRSASFSSYLSTVVVFALAVPAALVACSSPAPVGTSGADITQKDPTDSKGDTTKKTPTPTVSADAGTTTPSTSTDGGTTTAPSGDDPKVCGAKADLETCGNCCVNTTAQTQAGGKKSDAIGIQWNNCACDASHCATACKADFCTDPNSVTGGNGDISDACIQCLQSKTSDCDDKENAADDALTSDPDFQAVQACFAAAGCDSLPDPNAGDGAGGANGASN